MALWAGYSPAAGAQTTTIASTTGTTASTTSTTAATTTGSSATSSSTTTAPQPPPFDLATIRADQVAVVDQRFEPAVVPAERQLRATQSALAGAQAQLTNDQNTSLNAATTATLLQLTLRRDLTSQQQADAAAARAQATLATDRQALVTVAVQLYVGDPTDGPVDNVAQLERQGIARQLAQAAIAHIVATVQTAKQAATLTGLRAIQAGDTVQRDTVTLAGAQRSARQAAQAIGPDTARVTIDRQQQQSATVALDRATSQLNQAVAALGGPAPDGSISILGPSTLTAPQLTEWFDLSGFVDLTTTPVAQLAAWYVSEGTREGVRGDVAFAQSVVETGGFSSSDAITLHNYAGIGHCDSCAQGASFPSAQLGIRAQMQLLRTYATPGLTAAALPDPPATAAAIPQNDFRRGCCSSWQELTGTWATSPIYGPVILNVYQRILTFAVRAGSAPATN